MFIAPALKSPFESRATMVETVFALVALDVTVNVAALAWLAVKVCEPDKPVPDTFMVRVPLFATGAATHDGAAAPFDCRSCPEVPAANCAVVFAADWYGIVPALPPARLAAAVVPLAVMVWLTVSKEVTNVTAHPVANWAIVGDKYPTCTSVT